MLISYTIHFLHLLLLVCRFLGMCLCIYIVCVHFVLYFFCVLLGLFLLHIVHYVLLACLSVGHILLHLLLLYLCMVFGYYLILCRFVFYLVLKLCFFLLVDIGLLVVFLVLSGSCHCRVLLVEVLFGVFHL